MTKYDPLAFLDRGLYDDEWICEVCKEDQSQSAMWNPIPGYGMNALGEIHKMPHLCATCSESYDWLSHPVNRGVKP